MVVLPGSMRPLTIDLPGQNRTYSSIFGNNEIGAENARSMLSSPQSRSAKVNDPHQCMVLDAGFVVNLIDMLILMNRGDKSL